MAGSLADFDAAYEADASLRPYLWQRGISAYYAGARAPAVCRCAAVSSFWCCLPTKGKTLRSIRGDWHTTGAQLSGARTMAHPRMQLLISTTGSVFVEYSPLVKHFVRSDPAGL